MNSTTPRATYLHPTQESGRAFVHRRISGELIMLNLLRFRAVADYSAHPQLAPTEPISGAEAFQRYIEHTLPQSKTKWRESNLLWARRTIIDWTSRRALGCRDASAPTHMEVFMAFASDAAYLEGMGHRVAALEDSRLLPLAESSLASGDVVGA